jgi:hypothetical protein
MFLIALTCGATCSKPKDTTKILDASFYAFADATLVQTIGADNVWTRDHRVLRAACALFGSAPTRCPNPVNCPWS